MAPSKEDRIPLQPDVIRWARESISLSPDAAAKKLGVSITILTRWEEGTLSPTIKQVRKMAAQYKRPITVLLLPSPPKDFDAMRDFRRTIGSGTWSPQLHGEYRRALEQREVYLDLASIAPGLVPETIDFPQLSISAQPNVAGDLLRDFLSITNTMQESWKDDFQALNAWVSAVESKGVIVIHTNGVPKGEMAGFSISESPYPVVALNGSDSPRRRIFTLLHECSHLAVNSGGLCDTHRPTDKEARKDSPTLERFCNSVASSAILPESLVLSHTIIKAADAARQWEIEELAAFAGRFHVSVEALLIRLIELDRATWSTYRLRKPELESIYKEAESIRKKRQKEGKVRPNYYRTKARNIGHGYAATIFDAFSSQRISSRDAASLLGIRFDQLESLRTVVR